ncbi:ABC transporter permease [Tessaracoccus antarcticus]|uniref:ABC transporter permease n=1 Tax=Tessaracoccus antarcticus TaxID=2479848 RepID=A0A3M0G8D2_9ACTN|nr:ABC transporter permease [Tessaracoccus antarcticus]RMB61225.1 ABC transporter permease [Tessaracoccus antarcticus]
MAVSKQSADMSNVRVYTPHKAGLPDLREYFTELWKRRDFAKELSDTNMRASNTNTVLGQLWLVLNPLMLAGVYYLLIFIISGSKTADFAQITSGLFLFFFISGVITSCATSVTNAGSLILNMNFPKSLLIMSNLYLSLRRFAPTMLVYLVIHVIFRKPWTLSLLWLPVVVVLASMISSGIGAIVATWHVYFRDTAQFLPYFIRVWLYLSPVLYSAEEFVTKFGNHPLGKFAQFVNPLFGPLGMWSDALAGHHVPWHYVAIAVAWAVLLFFGGLLYFISRERDFAVRL